MSPGRFRVVPGGLLTLGIFTVTLGGTIGLELRKGALDEVPVSAAPVRAQPESPPVSSSSAAPSDLGAHHVATILARPLFSPSRRPPVISANAKAPALNRLTGVVVSPAGKSAIFAGPVDGKLVVVEEGAHIGEYVVGRIDVGAVTIIGPDGQRVLHPAFDPSPPPKPPVPAPIPPPPAWALHAK